jgi:lipopolysaccharide transport system ATP-binding protein
MSEVSERGRTVLFVSHNMAAISHLCARVLVVESGRIEVDDAPNKAIAAYLHKFSQVSDNYELASLPRSSEMFPIIQKLDLLDEAGTVISAVPVGTHLTIIMHYKHSKPLVDPYFGLRFETIEGVPVFLVQTRAQKGSLKDLPASGTIACHIARFPLAPGTYFISAGCGSRKTQLDYVRRGCQLQVVEADVFGTGRLTNPGRELVIVDADWELEPKVKRVSQPIHEIIT